MSNMRVITFHVAWLLLIVLEVMESFSPCDSKKIWVRIDDRNETKEVKNMVITKFQETLEGPPDGTSKPTRNKTTVDTEGTKLIGLEYTELEASQDEGYAIMAGLREFCENVPSVITFYKWQGFAARFDVSLDHEVQVVMRLGKAFNERDYLGKGELKRECFRIERSLEFFLRNHPSGPEGKLPKTKVHTPKFVRRKQISAAPKTTGGTKTGENTIPWCAFTEFYGSIVEPIGDNIVGSELFFKFLKKAPKRSSSSSSTDPKRRRTDNSSSSTDTSSTDTSSTDPS